MNARHHTEPGRLGTQIRVVLADDHGLVRDGLCALLAREPDMEVVGTAADGLDAVRLVRRLKPDILVTDIGMPGLNGIDAVRRIHAEEPDVRLLCVSMHDDSRMVLAMLGAGASGYLLKDGSSTELAGAIRNVMARQVYLSPPLVGIVVDQLRQKDGRPAAGTQPALTPRERELVQLMSEGYSSGDIAERLHVSMKTVATHRENLMKKLNVGSVAELTRYALREGLTQLDAPCGGRQRPRND